MYPMLSLVLVGVLCPSFQRSHMLETVQKIVSSTWNSLYSYKTFITLSLYKYSVMLVYLMPY
jgi:hypothetical protein